MVFRFKYFFGVLFVCCGLLGVFDSRMELGGSMIKVVSYFFKWKRTVNTLNAHALLPYFKKQVVWGYEGLKFSGRT